ncbi:MAG: hypothetical protein WA160_07545 [Pseudobdellovibrio sp.]
MSLETNPALTNFNHPAEATKVFNVQDPLPDFKGNSLRQMNFYCFTENLVG